MGHEWEYSALVIISPGSDGEDVKDQDRAAWYPESRCAVVCDGVTTSLHARTAAEQTARFAPALFEGNVRERLAAWVNYLQVCRDEACARPLRVSATLSGPLQAMLQETACRKAACAYQTTCVAAAFAIGDDHVQANILQIGDSQFLAFGADGRLLWPASADGPSACVADETDPVAPTIVRPGDDVLIRWLMPAEPPPESAHVATIPAACRDRWLVGEFVQSWRRDGHVAPPSDSVRIVPGDLLFIPRHLAGSTPDSEVRLWSLVPYSPTIRVEHRQPMPTVASPFAKRGVVTAVLPDDFATGRWGHFQERFPLDSVFVLASDGFTSAFGDAAALWTWLSANHDRLRVPAERASAMDALHARLRAREGDDDITLVCVYPRSAPPGLGEGNTSRADDV